MTIQGAIAELQNLVDADDVPFYYKNGIKKVIETIQMDLPIEPKRPRGTETMMVDGEPMEIDPVSYEVGYTHGQTAPTVNEDHISKESVGDEGITFR